MENPGEPLLPYRAIRITAELKKKAIPIPTMNRSKVSSNGEDANPERRDAAEATVIPKAADIPGLNLAANIPAGIWNKPIPIKNEAEIEPSKDTSPLNSNNMNGNIEDMLNQFTPYTILATIKESEA
jgi:hypothetical protein